MVLTSVAVLFLVFVVWHFSSMLVVPFSIHPPFVPALLPEMGFSNFRYITIKSRDGTSLDLLHIPASESRGTVVIVHGLGDQKESYLTQTQFMLSKGFDTVLLDLRGHGRSQGRQMTMGYLEAEDIRAAVDWIAQQNLSKPWILWGISLGATSSLLAAGTSSFPIEGIIAESPFGSLPETVRHHAWLFYKIPSFPIVPLVLAAYRFRTGISADKVDAYQAVEHMQDIPVLFVAGGLDPRMPAELIQKLMDRKPGEKRLLVVPDGAHGQIFNPERGEYVEAIDWLLQRANETFLVSSSQPAVNPPPKQMPE